MLNSSFSTIATESGNSKKHFQANRLTGLYQEFDPLTGRLVEEGHFSKGKQTGKWRVIDQDGDQIHYFYSLERVGAICSDGTLSSATGRGACSWHGGVAEWLYEPVKIQTGGTGKYMPIEQKVDILKNEVKEKFKIKKVGPSFDAEVLQLLLQVNKQRQQLLSRVKQLQKQSKQKQAGMKQPNEKSVKANPQSICRGRRTNTKRRHYKKKCGKKVGLGYKQTFSLVLFDSDSQSEENESEKSQQQLLELLKP